MNGVKANCPNGVVKRDLSVSTSFEDHIYPKLFKVVQKDLFTADHTPTSNKRPVGKENSENNWEFFLNLKFDKLQVNSEQVFPSISAEEGLCEGTDGQNSVERVSNAASLGSKINNELPETGKWETERNHSKSFPELFSRLENSNTIFKSIPPRLSSLPNFSDSLRMSLAPTQSFLVTSPHESPGPDKGWKLEDLEVSQLCSVHGVHLGEREKFKAFACIVRIAAVLFVSLSVALLCLLGNIPDQYPDNMDKLLVRENRDASRMQEENGISFVSTKFKAPLPNIRNQIHKNTNT